MKLSAAMILSMVLFTLGCGQGNQSGSTATTSTNVPSADGVGAARPQVPVVRVADLEINPAQLENYLAAVREEMETSVRVEPGVLAIYAVAEKENPAKLKFFEMYTDEAAFKSHIESPHFKKYFEATKAMIVSRKLIETMPVQLSEKKR
jgi:quinol monooxygenase YgiN